MFIERKVVVGPFQCNCRILISVAASASASGTSNGALVAEALVIDPGDEPQKILNALDEESQRLGLPIKVRALFHTHGHLDHVGATRAVHEATTGAIWMHKADEPLYQALQQQGQLFGLKYDAPLAAQNFFEHEQQLTCGAMKWSVIHTPGHSPGSVSLRLHEDSALKIAETVYTGDTLFQSSVGRTDLWGANQEEMFKSIRNRLLTLDSDTRVCPGHGNDSLIGIEKHENPFLV